MKYTLQFIILMIVIFAIYKTVDYTNSNTKNKGRLACQQTTTTFERIYNKMPITEAIELLESNNYIINTDIDYSKYMQSKLINILSKEEAEKRLKNIINKHVKTKKEANKKLQINYYIYENDKEDKRKKGDNCKLYAGYVMFEFIIDKTLVYKIQSDYMKTDISDMNERIECSLESFISLKQN